MTRRRYTKRQIVGFWEAAHGNCWRCGRKIEGKPTPVYGVDWELGHVGAAHWAGGDEVAPEHMSCNRDDAKKQSAAAAKSVRIRARDIGIKRAPRHVVPGSKASKWKKQYNRATQRFETVLR